MKNIGRYPEFYVYGTTFLLLSKLIKTLLQTNFHYSIYQSEFRITFIGFVIHTIWN